MGKLKPEIKDSSNVLKVIKTDRRGFFGVVLGAGLMIEGMDFSFLTDYEYKERLASTEKVLRTHSGVSANWQPEGKPLSEEKAASKAQHLKKIGFSSTRLAVNRARLEDFSLMVKAIDKEGMDIGFVCQQDSISDHLFWRLTTDYAKVVKRLIELENAFHYEESRDNLKLQEEYQWLLGEHSNLSQELAPKFVSDYLEMAEHLLPLLSGRRLSLEVWNEPNSFHGEGRIPQMRPDFYAEIVKQIDQALLETKLSGKVTPVYGVTFGPPPELAAYDGSSDYLAHVLVALDKYRFKSPHDWSCHLYPGAREAQTLVFRVKRILQVLEKYGEDKQDLHLTEVGYARGERQKLGWSQKECWTNILVSLYPFMLNDSLRTVNIFNYDWSGDADYSYPETEEEFSLTEVAKVIDS